jgi:hypothetical protein
MFDINNNEWANQKNKIEPTNEPTRFFKIFYEKSS